MAFESWGIIEVMGHKVYAGKLSEQEIAGVAMLRVDVPECGDIPGYTKFFAAGALYGITPTDEASAQAAALKLRERPISPFVLPMLAASTEQTLAVRSSEPSDWDDDAPWDAEEADYLDEDDDDEADKP